MKLAILLFAALAHGAPVTFTAAGAVGPITDGWYIDLVNFGPGNPANRVATFTVSEPITGLMLFADNSPNSVGAGWQFYLDGGLVLNTGVGILIQQTLEFVSAQPFTTIRVEANYVTSLAERGNLTNWRAGGLEITTQTTTVVPEPGTRRIFLVAAIGAFVGKRLMDRFRRKLTATRS